MVATQQQLTKNLQDIVHVLLSNHSWQLFSHQLEEHMACAQCTSPLKLAGAYC
jgi:hypothetical protein